jgi:hypothetical protein
MDIPFIWEGQGDFHAALYRPIQRVALTMLVGRPSVLYFGHPDGSWLRIANQMHDLADRREVGSLALGDGAPPQAPEFEVQVSAIPLRVDKLILVERNVRIEAGIAIQLTATRELRVLPGAYPYTLAIEGLWDQPHVFEPEYPTSEYRRELIPQ